MYYRLCILHPTNWGEIYSPAATIYKVDLLKSSEPDYKGVISLKKSFNNIKKIYFFIYYKKRNMKDESLLKNEGQSTSLTNECSQLANPGLVMVLTFNIKLDNKSHC